MEDGNIKAMKMTKGKRRYHLFQNYTKTGVTD